MGSSRASALDVDRSSVLGGEGVPRGSLLATLANATAPGGSSQLDGQQQSPATRNSISFAAPTATLTIPHGPHGALHAELGELSGPAGARGSLVEKPRIAVESLPVRQYLDLLVVPALLPALTTVVTERPDRPVEFLAHWLLENVQKFPDSASPTDFAAGAALLGGVGGSAN